jgi:hypothetical protein
MVRKKLLTGIVVFIGMTSLMPLYAQNARDTINYDVYSISGYQPVVTNAIKLNENPVIQDSTQKIPVLTYSINAKEIEIPFSPEPIAPAKMVGEPIPRLTKTLIKGGMGNYATAYGELFFNNLRSKEMSYGAHLKHLSSASTLKGEGYSGYSDNLIRVYGKRFFKQHTLTGDFDYSRNVVHNYGYDISLFKLEKNIIKQRYTLLAPSIGFKSFLGDSTINYDLYLGYYHFAERFQSAENNVSVKGIFSGFLNKEKIVGEGRVDYYNYQRAGDTVNNTIIRLNPSIVSNGEKFKASIGLGTAADITDTATNFYFYPRLEASYSIADNVVIPYVGLTGDLDKNSYRSLAEENPFIKNVITTANSNKRLEFYGGLKGTLSSATSYSTKVSYSKIDNMYFFVNDTIELPGNRFEVIYDDVKLLKLHGEVAYQQAEKLRFIIKADYNKYTTTRELRAWHKPALTMTFSTNYNLKDKIVIKADVFVIDKQFARTGSDTTTCVGCASYKAKELKGITDLNLGIEYRYNKALSAFINFNNIGSVRYYRWNNYPTQRLNIIGGASFAF